MKTKKIIMQIGCFIFLFFLLFFLFFKKLDFSTFFKILKKANYQYLILGFLFMFLYILCEAINIYQVLKNLKEKTTIFKTLKYAIIGFFFSAITPSSSGGQPMQLYGMAKDDVKVAHGTIALLLQITSYQIIVCTLGLVGLLFHFHRIIEITGSTKYFLFLGMLINLIILSVLFSFLFYKKILFLFEKIVKKLAIIFKIKKIDSFLCSLNQQIEEYQNCTVYLKKNKKLWIKIIGITFLQVTFSFSIPFLVSLALKLNAYSYFSFFSMQSVLFFSISSLPFPGAMGVGEGVFLLMYQFFIPKPFLNSAMLLTRFINFYAMLIITSVILLFISIRTRNI